VRGFNGGRRRKKSQSDQLHLQGEEIWGPHHRKLIEENIFLDGREKKKEKNKSQEMGHWSGEEVKKRVTKKLQLKEGEKAPYRGPEGSTKRAGAQIHVGRTIQ